MDEIFIAKVFSKAFYPIQRFFATVNCIMVCSIWQNFSVKSITKAIFFLFLMQVLLFCLFSKQYKNTTARLLVGMQWSYNIPWESFHPFGLRPLGWNNSRGMLQNHCIPPKSRAIIYFMSGRKKVFELLKQFIATYVIPETIRIEPSKMFRSKRV